MALSVEEICREAVEGLDGAIECRLLEVDSGRELAACVRDPEGLEASRRFASLAVEMLGAPGQQQLGSVGEGVALKSPAEFHVAGELTGFARLLPGRGAVLVLTARSLERVGMGWAMLSVAAARLESQD